MVYYSRWACQYVYLIVLYFTYSFTHSSFGLATDMPHTVQCWLILYCMYWQNNSNQISTALYCHKFRGESKQCIVSVTYASVIFMYTHAMKRNAHWHFVMITEIATWNNWAFIISLCGYCMCNGNDFTIKLSRSHQFSSLVAQLETLRCISLVIKLIQQFYTSTVILLREQPAGKEGIVDWGLFRSKVSLATD